MAENANVNSTRAAEKWEFYVHLIVYFVVGSLLAGIDLAGNRSASTVVGLDWAFWIIGGFGVGVLIHALAVFAVKD